MEGESNHKTHQTQSSVDLILQVSLITHQSGSLKYFLTFIIVHYYPILPFPLYMLLPYNNKEMLVFIITQRDKIWNGVTPCIRSHVRHFPCLEFELLMVFLYVNIKI